MFLLSLLPRQMQKMKAQWVWKYQQVREIIFSDDISICFGLSDQSMRNQDRALWQWGNRAELLQGSWEDCCCSPVQAYYLLKQQKCYLAYRPGQILANTGLSPLISLYSAVFSNMVMYVWVLLAQSIPEPLTFSAVTLLSQAAHAGHSHLSVLCRTQHWDSTNLAVSLYFFFFLCLHSFCYWASLIRH